MNGNSKRERVDCFIRRAVREGIAEWCITNPSNAEWLSRNIHYLCVNIAGNISGDAYRMKELADIMAWKQPPEVK